MNDLLRYLIIITLAYYFLKILMYIVMWQMSYKIQERALASKKKEMERRKARERIWKDIDDDK
jgi:low temperature requirement protein LtrA